MLYLFIINPRPALGWTQCGTGDCQWRSFRCCLSSSSHRRINYFLCDFGGRRRRRYRLRWWWHLRGRHAHGLSYVSIVENITVLFFIYLTKKNNHWSLSVVVVQLS